MQTKIRVLLADFGYRVEGGVLIENAIRGFTSERVVTRVSDSYDAAERLCPILSDAHFTRRFVALTGA